MRSRNEQLPVWWVAVRHRKRDIFEVCRHHCMCAVPRQIVCYEKEDGLWSVVGMLKIYETGCFMVEWPNDVVLSFKALVVEYARCTHREWLSFTYGISKPIRLERVIPNFRYNGRRDEDEWCRRSIPDDASCIIFEDYSILLTPYISNSGAYYLQHQERRRCSMNR